MVGIVHDLSSLGKGGVHFVVSSGVEKPDSGLRKLIRSHVMMGKNKGRSLPPRNKKGSSKATEPQQQEARKGSSRSSTVSIRKPSTESVNRTTESLYLPGQLVVPRQFGSFLSAIPFADIAIDPKSVEVVIQLSSIAKQTLFPHLEPCIFFDRRAESWIMPLSYDPAFLHVMIFASHFYFSSVVSRRDVANSRAILSQCMKPYLSHYTTGLRLLRERFESDDVDLKLSFTTAAIIMTLVGHAFMSGDVVSARHHMDGLAKIVRMRGGMGSFGGSEKLLLEIFRCDIGIALSGGTKPVFFAGDGLEPLIPYPDLKLFLRTKVFSAKSHRIDQVFFNKVNTRLRRIWEVMLDFCAVIDLAAISKQKITTEMFSHSMASIIYRLLGLSLPSGSLDEVIRIGLLAFASSVFLQWSHLGMNYTHLRKKYSRCLQTLNTGEVPPDLSLWLLVVGALTVFDLEGEDSCLMPLLRNSIERCEIRSWGQMKELLVELLWIDVVFNTSGEKVFNSLKLI